MDNYAVQIVDVIVASLVFISAVIGFIRGFTREVLGIISWLVAFFVTIYAYEPSLPLWTKLVDNESLAAVLAVCVVFVGVVATLLIITNSISNRIDEGPLNTLDSTGGFLFGALRGFVIVCLIYLVFVSISGDPEDLPESFLAAKSLPVIEEGSVMMIKLLPTGMQETAQDIQTKNVDDDKPRAKPAPKSAPEKRIFAPAPSREKPARAAPTPPEAAPPAETPTAPAAPSPYKPEEKRDLDSLIEGLQ